MDISKHLKSLTGSTLRTEARQSAFVVTSVDESAVTVKTSTGGQQRIPIKNILIGCRLISEGHELTLRSLGEATKKTSPSYTLAIIKALTPYLHSGQASQQTATILNGRLPLDE